MSEHPSPAWTNFERDFLNANSWPQRKDGFPADLLEALSPEERQRAETILLERLDGRDDWPILGVALLGSKRAIPVLEQLLKQTSTPALRALTARALFELTGDTSLEVHPARLATDVNAFWGTRIDAIYHLARFRTATAQVTLESLQDDSEYLVAYNAKRALQWMRRL